MLPPMECPRPTNGGGQSGSTISFMKRMRSRSYSQKPATWPLCGLDSMRCEPPCPRQSMVATAKQIGDDLEIFLDEFGTPAQQAYGAPARHARSVPARIAQLGPVVSAEGPDGSPARNRILGERYQLHRAPSASVDSSPPSYRRRRAAATTEVEAVS